MNNYKNEIESLVQTRYEQFVGLPNNNPIVRNNIVNDAYPLVILDLLYKSQLKIDINPKEISKISKFIIAPPDSGIDMFIELEDNNEYTYHIIQSKYQDLSNAEIDECFAVMRRTIKSYLRDPFTVKTNLRNVISETNFNKETYNRGKSCRYIVVHKGDLNYSSNKTNNEDIITINDLTTIYNSIKYSIEDPKVPYEEFKADSFNNYIEYNTDENQNEKALLCNLRGYDLAILCNKYDSSSVGRNILFGQNLRESLDAKSRTYEDMCNTINDEPQRFWHYNNGITILTKDLDLGKRDKEVVDTIKLTNFSIINGAQTTSSLGRYYKEAKMRDNPNDLEKLKKVFVLTRIMKVNNDELRDRICIYNNSQNPISTRDMVSTRREQKLLQQKYLNGEKPNIYIEIRSGSKPPQLPRFEKHQKTDNESLAQLAFAAFLLQPFSAKNKKKKLFNKSISGDFLINEDYQKIFYYPESENDSTPKGILFQKNRFDIDEALFVKSLYKEANKYLKKTLKTLQDNLKKQIEQNPETAQKNQNTIDTLERSISISSLCMFFCVTYYFALKDLYYDLSEKKSYNYDEYYRGGSSEYKKNIICDFADFFLSDTIEIIKSIVGNTESVNNWIRGAKSQKEFEIAYNEKISLNLKLINSYKDFMNKYKI